MKPLVNRKFRIAVIGSGVAGLSAAYHLRNEAHVTLYEAEGRLGGHANSIEVNEKGYTLGLDTAFIVSNTEGYRRFSQFIDDTEVGAVEQLAGFEFFDCETGEHFGSAELGSDEEYIKANFSSEFLSMWREAQRFYDETPRHFIRRQAEMPLGEYLDINGYSQEFRHGFVTAISAAVWSVPKDKLFEMPAATIIAFFYGHGKNGLGGRDVTWRTVRGGSISYVRHIRNALVEAGGEVRLAQPVTEVTQKGDTVVVETEQGSEEFDYAVVATHSDDSARMLSKDSRFDVLGCLPYASSKVVLHTDARQIPIDKSWWQAWNYGRKGSDVFCVYYLNNLQQLPEKVSDYFVTVNPVLEIAPDKVIQEFTYRHPVFSAEVRRRQPEFRAINVDSANRIKIAGGYLATSDDNVDLVGNHEAGFCSGIYAANRIVQEISTTATEYQG